MSMTVEEILAEIEPIRLGKAGSGMEPPPPPPWTPPAPPPQQTPWGQKEPRFYITTYDDGQTWDVYAKHAGDIRDVLRDRGWGFTKEEELHHERNVWTTQDIPTNEMCRERDWIWQNGWRINGKTREEVGK